MRKEEVGIQLFNLRRYGRAFWRLIRAVEWWHYKLPFPLAVAFVLGTLHHIPFVFLILPCFMILSAGIVLAVYSSVFNDFLDQDQDRKAGKVTPMMALKNWQQRLVVGFSLAAILLVGSEFAATPRALTCFIIIWFMITAYSLPPLRLKERSALGVVAIATAEHLIANLLAVFTVAEVCHCDIPVAWLAALLGWSFAYGCRGIIWHQITDVENDEKANCTTLGARIGARGLRRLGESYLFPIEIICFAILLLLSHNLVAWLLLAPYALMEWLRCRYLETRMMIVAPVPNPRMLLLEYYLLFFPVAFLLKGVADDKLSMVGLFIFFLMFPAQSVHLVHELEYLYRTRTRPFLKAIGLGMFSLKSMVSFLVLAALIFIAYNSILFNFFVGDDFVHLGWLQRTYYLDPSLVFKNFYSNWLDVPTTTFYRPLISVFMMTDYLIWHENALGFHITNVLFHLMSSCFIYLIVSSISQEKEDSFKTWPLAAASLFALYPLSTEVVSWITGRVDVIAVAFFLGCISFYIQWRNSASKASYISAIVFMILALMSKEIAIVIPVVLLSYELSQWPGRFSENFFSKAIQTFKPTLSFWLVLLGYFLFKKVFLGSAIGGYDNSLGLFHEWSEQLQVWASALKVWLVPVNGGVILADSPLTALWILSLVLAAVLILLRVVSNRQYLRPVAFLFCFILLSFLPVYKVLSIAFDLQGSRTGYLASAPLCMLLTVGCAGMAKLTGSKFRQASRVAIIAFSISFCILSGVILSLNNQSWSEAGHMSNALRASFKQLFQSTPNQIPLAFFGLPDNIHGAYLCRNAMGGLTGGQRSNIVDLSEGTIVPIGIIKDVLVGEKTTTQFYRWECDKSAFTRVRFQPAQWAISASAWNALPDEKKYRYDRNGLYLFLNLEQTPPWLADFIVIELTSSNKIAPDQISTLLYFNRFGDEKSMNVNIDSFGDKYRIVIPLRGEVSWVAGDGIKSVRISVPRGAEIHSVTVSDGEGLMPIISIPKRNMVTSSGLMDISADDKSDTAVVDVGCDNVPGACGLMIETTQPSRMFSFKNSTSDQEPAIQSRVFSHKLHDSIHFDRSQFKVGGLYQERVWATDKNEKLLGVPSDHVNLMVR